MFERFSRAARLAVTDAVAAAEQRRDRSVGTEHLLLGLARSPVPVVAATLRELGVDADGVMAAMEQEDAAALAAVGVDLDAALVGDATSAAPVARRRRPSLREHRPFTGGAKRALEGALAEARVAGDRRIGPEHVLLAVAAMPSADPAMPVLDRLGVEPQRLREALTARMRRVA